MVSEVICIVDKLLKLKSKEFKQISTKEKNETKAKYEYGFRLFIKIK